MTELLMLYTCFSLAAAPATLPIDPQGFMPFQQNYWLWKIIGFGGLATFQARWIVQWLHSEKHRESRIPIAFWWLSLAGSLLELAYFLRQQDSVGVMGYCFSAVPYTRNLVLVYRKRRLEKEAADAGIAAGIGAKDLQGK
jgi:lipid-A-disaccharide synthase-like uncharacterized protein